MDWESIRESLRLILAGIFLITATGILIGVVTGELSSDNLSFVADLLQAAEENLAKVS